MIRKCVTCEGGGPEGGRPGWSSGCWRELGLELDAAGEEAGSGCGPEGADSGVEEGGAEVDSGTEAACA